jgi:hypothetical protein
MKKLLTITATALLLTFASSSLFAVTNSTATLKLVAVVTAKATFQASDNGISVVSNNNRFSYSYQDEVDTRTLFVVAK